MSHLMYPVVLFLLTFCPLMLCAQQLSISGTVRDPQAVAPGVSVTLRNPSGGARQATTDSTGAYRFEGLGAGTYELSFAREGFETATRTLSLSTAARTVDVTLSLSGVTTSLQVIDVAGKATSSRMEIPDIDLPVQVSSIPAQVLEQQGANDLVTALRNASGVQAQRFYGIYEYYTIRGFNTSDVLLVDGMRLEGNRYNTQLNNVEQVEVLKGPSSILYGSGALGGAINLIRKKPQGTKSYDLFYKGGRFNTHQVGGGATGPLVSNRLLYRVDTSFDHSDGWRGAGADRFNLSPTVTWLINNRARVTVHQAFNHDNFDGDGGLPVSVLALPNFDLSRRFSTPYDFGHVRDSQTNVLFNANLSPAWEFRDAFFYRWTNDQYFVTEGVGYDADLNEIDRYALYFKHHRRPKQNQADVVGRVKLLGMRHTLLAGYEYQDYYNFTDRTPDGGDYFPEPISLSDFKETQTTPFTFPVVRVDYFANRIHAFYWQDQISVTENLTLNVGGRFDDYQRITRRDPWANGAPTSRGTDTKFGESAYTYRAGLVYSLPKSQQVYFNSSSSFAPVTFLPANGQPLDPESGRGYEFGHRWQGFNGRVQTSLALYRLERNNVVIFKPQGLYDQAGQQSSKGIDFDVNADLGWGVRMFANYGYTSPRYDQYSTTGEDDDGNEFVIDYSGHRPYFVQKHAANAWLTKSWKSGFTASIGLRYLSSMFTNSENSIRLGGWTTFNGAVGYRRAFWEWTLNAENLLNRNRYFLGADYSDQVYPGAPINVFTTVRFRFR